MCAVTSNGADLNALQPTLQKLGIQLSKHKVAALTREERDAAAQLLYRIKSALATMNSSIVHGQGLSSNKLAATFGVKLELSKGLLEAQQFRWGFLAGTHCRSAGQGILMFAACLQD